MKKQLKIKISIADRVYPMNVFPEQEESLRLAAQKINNVIKHFEENYAVRDKQDVLAMSALQFASKVEQMQLNDDKTDEEIEQRLIDLNEKLVDQIN
ncbi:cell division protein ZapA [Mesohalobacter halotolerans]|uniref:Cell division protein ZapA n=1 Tax=Mesohalobacter halotolerans TaxID=1883405 RepID=A0A4U5TPV0_9FLAO|nr:cell division protein ZapA [Mesohalobacter halotolerans]MBS3739193.1 cell division protein ZapA [Psychroflexus sp.]TKS56023.1 cell division protein ZapA [Mesohalobacter halotolerans]